MPMLAERKQDQRFMSLFVGKSGTGKTVAEASFPKPIRFEDFDGRIGGAQVSWLDLKDIEYQYWAPKMEGIVTKLNTHLDTYLTAARIGKSSGIVLPTTHCTDSITNLTYALLSAAIKLSHTRIDDKGKQTKAGKWFEAIAVEDPGDYKLEATGTYDYLSFLKSIPIPNVIISAHYVDRYGKPTDEAGEIINPYADSVIIGKKLSIRDKIGENIQTSFDHIFEFEREVDKFYVKFRGELARTTFEWLPNGKQDWTGKNFYQFMMSFKPKGIQNVAV